MFFLFLPGYVWSFSLSDDLDLIERIVIAFGLSISIIPLFLYILYSSIYFSLTLVNSLSMSIFITLIGILAAIIKSYSKKKYHQI